MSSYQCGKCASTMLRYDTDRWGTAVVCMKCGNRVGEDTFVHRYPFRKIIDQEEAMKKGHIIKPSSYPIGLRIIALRKALNLKQGELARQAAISVDALVKAERRLCSPEIATKLSPILGVVPNYILEGPDRGQPDDMAAVAKPAAAKPAKLPGGFHHSLKGRIYVDPPPERQPENTETEAPAKRALPDELKKAISVLPIPDHNGDRPDPRDHGIYLPGVITQGYDRITIILERVRG